MYEKVNKMGARMNYKNNLRKKIFMCKKGWFLWHFLLKKHPEIQNTAVILMPDKINKTNFYFLHYLNDYLSLKGRDNAVVLTHDSVVYHNAKKVCGKIIDVIHFDSGKAKAIMVYASLYCFDDRLVIASLDEPIGRDGRSLIGLNNLTEEEVIAIGVYGILPFNKKPITKDMAKLFNVSLN